MQIPPPTYSKSYQIKLKEMEVSRRQVQIDNEVEYQKALVEIKDEIRDKEGDEIVEKMKEEIRDWFQEDKEETIYSPHQHRYTGSDWTGFGDFKNNQIELVLALDIVVIDKFQLKQFNQNQSPVAIHM